MIRLKPVFENKRQIQPRGPGRPFEIGNKFGNRFQPGQSGNPGGRPKEVRDLYKRVAAEKVRIKVKREDGQEEEIVVPRIEEVARTQFQIACTMMPHSVTAFRTIREIIEPTEEEQKGSSDRDFTRMVVQLLMERKAPV